jgi:hypothetical protein
LSSPPIQFLRDPARPVHHTSQPIARSQRQYGSCIRENGWCHN